MEEFLKNLGYIMSVASLFAVFSALTYWANRQLIRGTVDEVGRTVGLTVSGLIKAIDKLDRTMTEERSERIKNQTAIAGIQSDIKANSGSLVRVEKKIDDHIAGH